MAGPRAARTRRCHARARRGPGRRRGRRGQVRVVDHQYIGPVRPEPAGDRREGAGRELVIAVDEPQVLAASLRHAEVACMPGPADLRAQWRQPSVIEPAFLQQVPGIVPRVRVDGDYLDVTEVLLGDRVEARRDIRAEVIDRYDNTQQRRGPGLRSRYLPAESRPGITFFVLNALPRFLGNQLNVAMRMMTAGHHGPSPACPGRIYRYFEAQLPYARVTTPSSSSQYTDTLLWHPGTGV